VLPFQTPPGITPEDAIYQAECHITWGGWAKCPEGAFQLQPPIRLIAEVTLRSTHYFGELLSFGPQAEASHIRPPMNRNVPTKEGSEASFRFIVLRIKEVAEGNLGEA